MSEKAIDSGMDAETVAAAEMLWANLPTGRKWTKLPTHEKALVCHAVGRITRLAPKADGLVEELERLLDRDRYIVAIALGHIRKALDGHRWLLEGRGPYEWDDDRYREEFTAWLEDVEASTGLLAKLACDKGGCTTDAVKVQEAREAARMYAVNTPVGHRTMLPSDLGLPCPSCAALKDRDVVLEEAVRKAEDNAWQEARELVRGTNADMCKTAGRAYQIIQEGMTDAVNNRDLRTLRGRVEATARNLKERV